MLYTLDSGLTYVAMFDKEDNLVCHPKINQIGKNYTTNRRLNSPINHTIKLSHTYDLLMEYKQELFENGEIVNLEIIHENYIRNKDLRVVSIINLDSLLLHITKLERRLYVIFILMGVIIIIISFFIVRYIASIYEKGLESKNSDLENDIINITKLNLGVFTYQQKFLAIDNQLPKESKDNTTKEENKKLRLLGYKGNEIVPIATNTVSYIYTENSITYIVNKQGKKTTSSASLDEIYKDLDTNLFFRANRQFIIHIITIEKIIKYGKSQLKIVINNSDVLILIKKNKVAEFKRWLNI